MNIIGKSECSASQMAQYLINKNPAAKAWALEYAQIYLEEGEAEGVRADGAWIQSCKETGNFKFTGGTAVTFDQNNFCGLGVTRKGIKGLSFATPRLGIRAQIQHLKGYATSNPLANTCIDPRYRYISKGCAPRFEDLAGKWAVPGYDTSKASGLQDAMNKKIGYGFDIIAGIEAMKRITLSSSTVRRNNGGNKMAYTLQTNYADKSNYGSYRPVSKIQYIVWHYTGNDGDTDEANAKYFKTANRKASAHYFVDDDSVTISVPDTYVAWSVGGSRYSNYKATGGASLYKIATNANTINIELCDTRKNGKYDVSEKTLSNAVSLTKELMKKYNIPVSNVIRHFDVTGKSCPAYFVNPSKWASVKKMLEAPFKSETPSKLNSAKFVYNGTDYSLVFNPAYYADKYADLRKAFGSSSASLFHHFTSYGMKEGRQGISTFNVTVYRNKYADLRKAFGGDLPAYYKHYIQFGKKEGRKAIS